MIRSLAVIGLIIVLLLAGCRSTSIPPPQLERIQKFAAGSILIDALERQGYSSFAAERVLTFTLRTETGRDESLDSVIEIYTCDTQAHRIYAVSSGAAEPRERFYYDGRYRERRGARWEDNPVQLLEGRERALDDYFFTILPFLIAEEPAALKDLGETMIRGIRYQVMEIRFQNPTLLTRGEWFRLFYSPATQRLEKVFYPGRRIGEDGLFYWCEYDNFADIEGVLLPLHRTFTPAEADEPEPAGRFFCSQWISNSAWGGSLENGLFPIP